jgi:predicted nuclease of restriction endonuclease-like RecB superfamily
MENKKIKNATAISKYNIQFKSKIEARVYELLLQAGFNPEYETKTLILWEGFKPTVPYYKRTKAFLNQLEAAKVRDITYTPDFFLHHNGLDVFIEVKGFINDVFPMKKKLFKKYLETYGKPVMVFEITTLRQLQDAITKIKQYEKPS